MLTKLLTGIVIVAMMTIPAVFVIAVVAMVVGVIVCVIVDNY
jgi:hypothetical protein